MPCIQRTTNADRLRGLSRGWSTLRTRVTSERSGSMDHRMEALASLGHLPED